MPLKKSTGHMYSWVTHVHAELGPGACQHRCAYCYTDNRWGRAPRYCGEIRLLESETKTNFGAGNIIFKEHMNDLFASNIPNSIIKKIIGHCIKYPNNTYVFQTKNPIRYLAANVFGLDRLKNVILGTTIETNRYIPRSISVAPQPTDRYVAMRVLNGDKFLTLEPIMDFDVDDLAYWIIKISPKFVNIGADSKGHRLPEPSIDKIYALIYKLKESGIEIREKHNLSRLTNRKIIDKGER